MDLNRSHTKLRLTPSSFGTTLSDVAHCSFKGIREGTCHPSGGGADVCKPLCAWHLSGPSHGECLTGRKTRNVEMKNFFWLTDIHTLHLNTCWICTSKNILYQQRCKGLQRSAQPEPWPRVLLHDLNAEFSSRQLEFGLSAVDCVPPRQKPEGSLLFCVLLLLLFVLFYNILTRATNPWPSAEFCQISVPDFVSVCLSVCLSDCQSLILCLNFCLCCLSLLCLSVCVSVSVRLYVCFPVVSVLQPVGLFTCCLFCLYERQSAYLSVCLSELLLSVKKK